jgi:ribosomal protein L40E
MAADDADKGKKEAPLPEAKGKQKYICKKCGERWPTSSGKAYCPKCGSKERRIFDPNAGAYNPANPWAESFQRATTAEETVQVLQQVEGLDPSSKRFVHETRKAYRDAAMVEGPLRRHELDGIAEYVRTSQEQHTAALSEATVQQSTETLSLDEAVGRFSPLLEAQTGKTNAALAEAAAGRAVVTEMSAKVAAAQQVIHELVRRVREKETALQESETLLSSAYTLIEAFAGEIPAERLRGAVEALAATHPHVAGIEEKLSEATDVTSAVRQVAGAVLHSLPPRFDRVQSGIDEALQASRQAEQQKLQEAARKPSTPGRTGAVPKGVTETTRNVVAAMGRKNFGR